MTSIPFFVREKEQIKVLSLDSSTATQSFDTQEPLLSLPTPKASLWSPDGKLLALAEPANGVQVVEFEKGNEGVHTLPDSSKTTQFLQWSPDSKKLVCTSPAVKETQKPNVVVYSIDIQGGTTDIKESASFYYPKVERDKKIFQWTPDGSVCARLSQEGNVLLYGDDLGGEELNEIALPHAVQNLEFAPSNPNSKRPRLAVFVGDVRDDMQRVIGPAEVTIWELAVSGAGDDVVVTPNRKAVASVSAGQTSELEWNASGTALLAHCQTEVDETGGSYYGGSKLLFLSHDGTYQIELTQDDSTSSNGTTVQAVAWSPVHDEFVLIKGFQPAQATLWSWDQKAQKASLTKVLLEKAHRNTIRFNHFGSLVCLAGFGNLAGDVDFFGRQRHLEPTGEKCDYQLVSSCKAMCTVSAEWSPDGRHFLTAVLAPRMRGDNHIGVWWPFTGTKVSQVDFEELFDAQWRPEPGGKRFEDIPAEEVERAIKDFAAGAGTAAPKKQAYRPPKARGEVSAGSNVAAMMRGEMAPDGDDRRGARRSNTRPSPPPRREEEGGADEVQDRRNAKPSPRTDGKDETNGTDRPAEAKAAARRPAPPETAVPSQPPPKAAGYPQQAAPKAAAPKAKVAAPQQAAAPPPNPAVPGQPWQPKSNAERGLQADSGPAKVSHGQKLAPPSSGWQYLDPKQNIQGPFALLEMQQWHAMGYFRPNLPMRCDAADRFVPFAELFPHPMIPFQSYPKRPTNFALSGLR